MNVDIEIKEEEAMDSGASLLIYSIDKNSIIGIDGLFNKKTQNFDLDFEKFTNNSLGVDENLARYVSSTCKFRCKQNNITSERNYKTFRNKSVCDIKNYRL